MGGNHQLSCCGEKDEYSDINHDTYHVAHVIKIGEWIGVFREECFEVRKLAGQAFVNGAEVVAVRRTEAGETGTNLSECKMSGGVHATCRKTWLIFRRER